MRIVVHSLSGKVPDTEQNTFVVVLDHPRRYVNAVRDLLAEAAAIDMLALCQWVHQTT